MRILLDENIPIDFAAELRGHDVSTVVALGWSGVLNGELMRRAHECCDVFYYPRPQYRIPAEHSRIAVSRHRRARGFQSNGSPSPARFCHSFGRQCRQARSVTESWRLTMRRNGRATGTTQMRTQARPTADQDVSHKNMRLLYPSNEQ